MNIKLLAPLAALALAGCDSLGTSSSDQIVYVVEASGGA